MSSPADSLAAYDDDLFEAAVEEFTRRWRSGEQPTPAEYAARFPQLAEVLNEVLPTIVAVEQTKSASDPFGSTGFRLGEVPAVLGDYRIVREIGRGGMGIVYEAVQESLGRGVALKVLPKQTLLDERRIARFEQEAKIAAGLHHTNIVPVFGVGHDDGLHYYVMQLIDGDGWDRRLLHTERRPSASEAARVGKFAAAALQYAHEQGTLHRDVKPANILIDRHDHVWLTDFGLAQVLEADATATTHVTGTLRYMPPERFHGVSDARGDVYSLGVALFEAVSGRSPFDARSNAELMKKITNDDPPRLRTVAADVPRDFETIVAKATAREPKDRYATAGELASDLDRFLNGVPIRARKVGNAERVWRWCKRNRLSAAALATAAAALVLLTVVSLVAYYRAAKLNEDLADSLVRERDSRRSAESTSATALAALDVVFDRFAPTGAFSASNSGGDTTAELSAGALSRSVPNVSPQIAAALEELLPFYLKLAAERGDDPQIRRQAASAMHRIGLIEAKLGRFDEARAAWHRSASLLAQLADEAPNDDALVTATAAIDCDVGDLERIEDRYDEARASYGKALDRLSDLKKPSFAARRELARADLSLAYEDRRPQERPHGDGPPDGRPPHPRPLGDFGGPPPFDGFRPEDLGLEPPFGRPPHPRPEDESPAEPTPAEAAAAKVRRAHLDAAFAELTKLHVEQPSDRRTRLLLALCRRERAKPQTPTAVDMESPDFQAAAKLLRELCAEFPTVPDYAFELSAALSDFHPRGIPAAQRDAALKRLQEALAISERLTTEYPQTALYLGEQTHILNRLATMQRFARDPQTEATYRRGIELCDRLTKQAPEVFVFAFWGARMRQGLAEYLAETHRGRMAETEAKAAIATLRKFVNSASPPPPAVELTQRLEGMLEHLQRPPPGGERGPPPF